MTNLIEYLRLSDQASKVREFMEVLEPVMDCFNKSSPFYADLKDLKQIVLVHKVSDDELQQVNDAKMRMIDRSNISSRFNKALRLFGTGKDLIAEVDIVMAALKEDEKVKQDFDKLCLACSSWTKPPECKADETTGRVEYPKELCEAFGEAYRMSLLITQKMSKRFETQHGQTLKMQLGYLDEVFDTLFNAVKNHYKALLVLHTTAIITDLQNLANPDSVSEKWTKILNALSAYSELNLSTFTNPDRVKT